MDDEALLVEAVVVHIIQQSDETHMGEEFLQPSQRSSFEGMTGVDFTADANLLSLLTDRAWVGDGDYVSTINGLERFSVTLGRHVYNRV